MRNVKAQGNALGIVRRAVPKPQRGAIRELATIAPRWGFGRLKPRFPQGVALGFNICAPLVLKNAQLQNLRRGPVHKRAADLTYQCARQCAEYSMSYPRPSGLGSTRSLYQPASATWTVNSPLPLERTILLPTVPLPNGAAVLIS